MASEDNHERILAAAKRRLLSGNGLSMREVAAEAGLSLGTINHYFVNKQGLVDALQKAFVEDFQAFAKALAPTVKAAETPRVAISHVAKAMCRWIRSQRPFMLLRILEKTRHCAHSTHILETNRYVMDIAARALAPYTSRTPNETRCCLYAFANMAARSAALDSPDELGDYLGTDADTAIAMEEKLIVESFVGYLLPRPT